MANQFVNIPVPAANGSGAAVDMSTFGAVKTIAVAGPFVASVTIEISNEVVPTTWSPLITFNNPDGSVQDVACHWMRATVSGYKSGTPACDIGGNDDGTFFANLPATVGNGTGAAVDVSTLPIYKTITVGGTYQGNVQIEVSEDGLARWSQINFGFPTPGQQSQIITAQFMRVIRQGVPQINPGLPIINVGACPIGGGGAGPPGPPGSGLATLTFRPGSIFTGPDVFNDFDDLYAALVTLRTTADNSGLYFIVFDDALATPCVVPAAAYDMTGVRWYGVRGPTTFAPVNVQLTDGGLITNLSGIIGLNVFKEDVAGSPPILVAPGYILSIQGSTISGGNGGAAGSEAIFTTDGALIRLEDQAFLATGAILIANNATLNMFMNGGPSGAFQNAIHGGATTTFNGYVTVSSIQWEDQTATMAGTIGLQQFLPYWKWGLGDPNGIVSSDPDTRLIDTNSGDIWRNTTGSDVWVLDAGGSPMTQFTFRPGSGLTGPSVFDDFNDLYAAFDAARSIAQNSGSYLIFFDDTGGGGITVDSGPGAVTYDFQYATLIGTKQDANTVVDFTSGGGEGDTLTMIHALWFEGLTVTVSGNDTGFEPDTDETITLTRTTISGAGGDRVFNIISKTGVVFNLENESSIERNGVFPAGVSPMLINGSTVTFHANGADCAMNGNCMTAGVASTINIVVSSSSARIDFNQADVGGFDSAIMNTATGYWTSSAPDTDPNGNLTATEGTVVIDEATGYAWKNIDGASAWVTNGVERLAVSSASSPFFEKTYVSGVGTNLTLANGLSDGFIKTFVITSGSGSITPSNLADGNVLTWTVTPANVGFVWDATLGTWHVLGNPYNMVTT